VYGTTASERAAMARGLAFLFGAGGLLVLLTLVLPHGENTDVFGVAAPAGAALIVSGGLLALRRQLGPLTLSFILAAGTALITVCVIAGGDNASAYPLMYVWVSLYAFYFYSLRLAAAHVAWCALSYGIALAVDGSIATAQVHWAMAIGTIVVAGVLIGTLTKAIRTQAQDLATVSQMSAGLSETGEHAQATCEGLRQSTGADVVVVLAPLPDGDGLQVTAMAGASEGGLALSGARARRALEACYRSGAAQDILSEDELVGLRRVTGNVLGLAQPVLRGNTPAGVLALAWTQPRLGGVGDGVRAAAALYAAEESVALERADRAVRERERRALEINDSIVQGLVVAKYAVDAGQVEAGAKMIDQTLGRARKLMTDQLQGVSGEGAALRPGDLIREAAPSDTA